MKKLCLVITLFSLNNLFAADTTRLYLGLYTAGTIEQYSKFVTNPYDKNLNYYTISFIPKVGIQFKQLTLGLMTSYTFHKNTLESKESLWGGGYFLKKILRKKNKFDYFLEWRHLVNDGYYVPIANWRRMKVKTPTSYISLQIGIDAMLPKAFSISLGMGLGSSNFLTDPFDTNSDKKTQIRPYGTITLQYN
jgi:hypothetical protein